MMRPRSPALALGILPLVPAAAAAQEATPPSVRGAIELSATAIEVLAVAVIVIAIAFGTARFLVHLQRQKEGAYERYKVHLGKSLLLGLEFLVAADIIRTVALEATMPNVLMLGMLVIVRTFLSWALVEFDTALRHIAHWANAALELKAISITAMHTAIKTFFRLRSCLFIMTFDCWLAFVPVTQI